MLREHRLVDANTALKSLAIIVSKQSLGSVAPSASAQFEHHLGLLSSRSDSQRRDSLNHLTSAITARPQDAPLPQPVTVIFPKALPLILDGNSGVRTQLLKLFKSLPPEDVKDQMQQLCLYIRAGLTHLAAGIRISTLELFDWSLEIGGEELVSCPGGWVKTLDTLLIMLAWTDGTALAGWTPSRAVLGGTDSPNKTLAKALDVLASFLRTGLKKPPPLPYVNTWPLWHVHAHMIPKKSNAYGYLNLFGPPRDEASQAYEDREDRQRLLQARFKARVEEGATAARKEGGEVGRAGAAVAKALEEGMKDAEGSG